ncbi:phage/plasmid primase, P4 family [Streptomyces sp. NPDC048604]|uniref:DNA primase family protein n=1 Tax=Streptomyces sp. NPDC048604 TaxID=3365578 RepID=UPI00371BC198
MTAETDVLAFSAFQRDKARQEKARQALEGASADEISAFEQWKTEQAEASVAKQRPTPESSAAGGAETTDAILAERVCERVLSESYCWSAGLGWMRWDGKRWERSNQQTVTETVRLYMVDAVSKKLRAPDTDWRKRQELMGLLSKGRLVALVELAKGILQVRDDMFDAHPDLLNTPSGVVDLKSGELHPHDRWLYLTHITAAAYRKGATHPDWDKALTALPSEVADWMQVRTGQSVTGHMTPDDVLLVLKGSGENAKSTFLETIRRCIGGGYGTLMSDRVLLADPGSHPTELMDLRGARLAVAEELPEDRRLNVKRLKDVVGTPTMKARYMKQDTVEWSSTHSILISTNYLPVVSETDHGTWRRLVLVTFPYKFLKPGQQPSGPHERVGDPGLRQRLMDGKEQGEAVLAWLVEGARRWYEAKRVMPPHPEVVVSDSLKWRADSDLILAYWMDRLEPAANSHVLSSDLLSDFNAWLTAKDHPKWSDKTFGARFEGHDRTAAHGVHRKKIRARDGLSRPESVAARWDAAPVGTSYRSWIGVRFAVETVPED